MTNKEAIEILQEEHNYCQEPYFVIRALEKAIEALKGRPAGEPLTLEQLREMDGQPVWVEPLGDEDWEPHWDVMKFNRISANSETVRGRMYFLYEGSYGTRWLAYAYPPARIDREAWGPCECCTGAKYVYGHASAVVPNGERGQIETEVDGDFDYCPECGRPLTEEAWAKLEKRIGDGRLYG